MDKFADTFGNIQLLGQVVRVDFMTAEPGQELAKGQAPRFVRDGQLIMPLEGFVRAYGVMGQMMQRLVEGGVLKAVPADAAAQTGNADAAAATRAPQQARDGKAQAA